MTPPLASHSFAVQADQSQVFIPPVSIPPTVREVMDGGFLRSAPVRHADFSKYLADMAHFQNSFRSVLHGKTDREGVALCGRVHPARRENQRRGLA